MVPQNRCFPVCSFSCILNPITTADDAGIHLVMSEDENGGVVSNEKVHTDGEAM